MTDKRPPYDEPAFPLQDCAAWQFGGMSVRDWMAGQALAGIIPLCSGDTRTKEIGHAAHYAEQAYAIADAMLIERGKPRT